MMTPDSGLLFWATLYVVHIRVISTCVLQMYVGPTMVSYIIYIIVRLR